jgi:cysteine desulfuration protein SufE
MNTAATLAEKRDALCAELGTLRDAQERLNYLVARARQRPGLAETDRTDANRVEGCLAKLWIAPRCTDERCFFAMDSDSLIVKAVAGLLCDFYSGHPPAEILSIDPSFLGPLGINQHLTPNRRNALAKVWEVIRGFARHQLGPKEGNGDAVERVPTRREDCPPPVGADSTRFALESGVNDVVETIPCST